MFLGFRLKISASKTIGIWISWRNGAIENCLAMEEGGFLEKSESFSLKEILAECRERRKGEEMGRRGYVLALKANETQSFGQLTRMRIRALPRI